MAARTPVLALAAGLGLVGAAVILETLEQRLPDLPAARPARALPSGPPPSGAAKGSAREGPPATRDPEEPPAAATRVTVTGLVVDEEGQPIGGAIVWGPEGMRIHLYHSWLWRAETDEDGRFIAEFRARSWRTDYRDRICSRVEADGYLDGSLEGRPEDWAVVESGGRLGPLRVVLRRAAILNGIVRDAAGRRLPGAVVVVGSLGATGEVHGWFDAETDEDGAYEIAGLDPDVGLVAQAEACGVASPILDLRSVLRSGETRSSDLEINALHSGVLTVLLREVRRGMHLVVDDDTRVSEPPDPGRFRELARWTVVLPVGRHLAEVMTEDGDLLARESVEVGEAGATWLAETAGN